MLLMMMVIETKLVCIGSIGLHQLASLLARCRCLPWFHSFGWYFFNNNIDHVQAGAAASVCGDTSASIIENLECG